MADLPALVTIKSIVEEAIWLARKDQNEYNRFFQYAINGFRRLNTFNIDNVKTEKLVMDSNHIIAMPSDLIKLIDVSVPIKGKKVSLSSEPRMVNTTTIAYGLETRDESDGENVRIAKDVTGFNAEPANVYGSYFVDMRNRRLIFNTDYRSEVIVDYTTSGISNENDLVPVYVKDALVAYMRLEDALNDPKATGSMIAIRKELWDDSQRDLNTFNMPSLDELRDALNNGNSGVPQR